MNRKLSRHAKGHPLRLTTFASSPKGTPLRYAGNFAATAKSRPLGEGGCERSEQTEGVFPQLPFAVTTPLVKMRLERSAERDKREI